MEKDIEQMSVDELKEEIKKYPYKDNRRYVFVSYSHRDAELVYKQVLDWLRKGYNIYIDVDFENHGSESNWVTIMEDCIRTRACSMITCFRSENYICSYAALLELLTIRSQKTIIERQNVGAADIIPIDIIEVGGGTSLPNFDDDDNIHEKYSASFNKMKKGMGKEFSQNNPTEGERLKEGLISWIDNCSNKRIGGGDGEARYMTIIKSYSTGAYDNFYSAIARSVLDWFASTDLNGNTKSLYSEGVINRFEDLKIYKKKVQAESSGNSDSLNGDQEEKTRIQPKPEKETAKAEEQAAENRGETYYFRNAVLTGEDGNYLLKAGSIVSLNPAKSCADNVKKLLNDSIKNGVIDGTTGKLLKDIPFRKLSPAACMVSGNSMAGSVWQTAGSVKSKTGRSKAERELENTEKASRPQMDRPITGDLKELFEQNKISEGTEVYIEGDPDSAAVITEEGRLLFKGNERTINEYIALAGKMRFGKRDPLSVIIDRNSDRSLRDLLSTEDTLKEEREEMSEDISDVAEEKEDKKKKRTEVRVEFIPEEVIPVEKTNLGQITIGEVRERLRKDNDYLFKLRDIRQNGLPFGAKSYMDYAMAAILNGCNSIKEDYQLNYYRYAIANYENKKEEAKTEATWTWSSNARKVVGYVSTGILPVQINNCFTELPETTTINELIGRFEASEEEAFITKKNNTVILCLQKFIESYQE